MAIAKKLTSLRFLRSTLSSVPHVLSRPEAEAYRKPPFWERRHPILNQLRPGSPMTAVSLDSNRRFSMAGWRILVLGVVLSITTASAAIADQISSSTPVDAFLNLGSSPYPEQSPITTGNAQPWYDSSQLTNFFGGQPTAQQQQSFDNAIMQDVQQSFSLSGVPLTLTDNPNVPADSYAQRRLEYREPRLPRGDRDEPDRRQRIHLHRCDRALRPIAQPARMDRRPQHLSRADAHLRGRRELRHDRELHRCADGELGDDHQPDVNVQPGRRRGPPCGDGSARTRTG